MGKFYVYSFCVCLCVQLVLGQFGFFPPRSERRYPSFGFQNFIPNTNGIRNTLNNILHPQQENREMYPFRNPNRPGNNQFGQNRPIFNNEYDQNRPVYNDDFNQNRPVNNDDYSQNRPVNNDEFYNDFNQNRPNNVRFPNQGVDPNYMNFEQPQSTSNPFEPQPDLVTEEPKDGADGVSLGTGPTFAPLDNDNDSFENKHGEDPPADIPDVPPAGIPNVPPPGFLDATLPGFTTLAPLTPVPDQEKRNNFNFGGAGIFKETCTTIDGGVGSCINIATCAPYVKLLKQTSSNPQAVQILRKAHCGFEGNNPKVCCPLQSLPNTPPPSPTPAPPAPTPAPTEASRSDNTAAGKSLPDSDYIPRFPVPPECGVSNASFSRVVGGVDAKLGDFLWMALLGYKGRSGAPTRWLCGGSFVSSRHVLTAAHCIHNHETDLYIVRLGELDLASEDDGASPIDVLIKNKIKHEGYNPKSFTNDIGLLILEDEVQYTDLIKPICLPLDSELKARTFEDYNPIIAGWGDTEFRGPSATHLQVLQLPVVSNEFCAKAYSEYKAQVIDERVLCAGYKKGGKDACQGDSGGPLMQPIYYSQNLTTYFYQIGVVSYGKKCAEAGFPGVYTRITKFMPWLEKNMIGTS